MAMVVSGIFSSSTAAHAVSSRPPEAAKFSGFIFGHVASHLEVTRRVVATRPPVVKPTPPAPAAPVAPPVDSAAAATPAPPVAVAPASTALPARGQATAYGCAAAIAYLTAYSAPGFVIQCPAYAGGHQATTTCATTTSLCNVERLIQIADPCAAAYMNEASNSWVLIGESTAPIDPYGKCY
jgi:hypothetical protein